MKKNKLVWTFQIILFVAFMFFGVTKFLTPPAEAAGVFESIGGTTMQYFTGAYEVISAILVAIPVTSFLGALMIVISMAVAIVLHIAVIGLEGFFLVLFILAIVFLAMAVFVMKKRKKDFLKGK